MLESLGDALAIRLMAQDDCIRNEPPDDYMAHYARHLPVWRVAEHEGDCPFVAAPAPVTCMRCFADSYLAKADDLIARPLVTALAEARAEGRRQGLEEAAARFDNLASAARERRDDSAASAAADVSEHVRALILDGAAE